MQLKSFQPTRQGLMALGVAAILLAAFMLRAAPFTLDPVRSVNASDQFDTNRAIARLERIIGDGKPHPVDSAALDAVRGRLLAEIEGLGFTPQVHTHDACRSSGALTRCARVSNIMFAAGPKEGKAVMLTAHYDSVDDSPGAGDDGIGVAVWLEVASQFAKAPPALPVVFLLTDGEEAALLGAEAFSAYNNSNDSSNNNSNNSNAYHIDIDRIINLEARGDSGPAMMFETSHANDDVVNDWSRNARRPVSNSLMTAVYEHLPNSTDLTIHLRDHHAGINIALADGYAFYHTEKDDLAHLDRRSVQHMGDQSLAAARTYASSSHAPHTDLVYADVLALFLVSLPVLPALLLLGLVLGLAAILMAKPSRVASLRVFDWRAFIAPPATALVAALAAFVMQTAIGLVRVEPAFWTAHPQALNVAIFLAALLAAALALMLVAPRATRAALFATGWFWFLAIGVGIAFVVPGVAMIFLIPGVAFVVAGVVARLAPRVAPVVHALAAAVALAIILPLVHLFDLTIGLAIAPAFGALAALALMPALCLIGPLTDRPAFPVAAIAAALAVAVLAAATLPAYSRDTPLSLDIYAHYDLDARKASVAATAPAEALPAAMRKALPGKPAPVITGFTAPMAHADLPFRTWRNARLEVVADTTSGDTRTLTLRMADTGNVISTSDGGDFADAPPAEAAGAANPASRFIRIRIPEAAHPLRFTYLPNGRPYPVGQPAGGYHMFDCFGRSCDGAELKVELKAPASGAPSPDWIVQGLITGLPPEAAPIAKLRPDWAIQIGTGDATIVTRTFKLP